MRLDAEGQVAQHLRTQPITQADVFESDHVPSPRPPIRALYQCPVSKFGRAPLYPRPRTPGRHGFQFVNGSADRFEDLWSFGRFAMLIVCPDCGTSYKVEPNSLGQGGRSVRCARCRNVWFATIPSMVSTLPGSDEWDVIDTGPRVPSVDSPVEPAVEAAAAPAVAPGAPAADV